jgi:hypothetical protein
MGCPSPIGLADTEEISRRLMVWGGACPPDVGMMQLLLNRGGIGTGTGWRRGELSGLSGLSANHHRRTAVVGSLGGERAVSHVVLTEHNQVLDPSHGGRLACMRLVAALIGASGGGTGSHGGGTGSHGGGTGSHGGALGGLEYNYIIYVLIKIKSIFFINYRYHPFIYDLKAVFI